MFTRRFASLLFFAILACGSLAARAQEPPCIQTSSGQICGKTSPSSIDIQGEKKTFTASAYLGIPYAVPPIGSLRWQYPMPFKSSATVQATAYGKACPQSLASKYSKLSSSQCTDGSSLGLDQDENCLYLNVWVPDRTEGSSPLPVMVFIHGGAFKTGSGGTSQNYDGKPIGNLYDGSYLAATGKVIVVTFNYRLGVLGFLAQNDKYNFGFADQILALNWIQSNIAGFGGDPKNVTLFGESAGAMSVGLHAFSSPKSSGLFQAGIMESNPLGLPYKSTAEAQDLRNEFCSSRHPSPCMASTSTCDLIAAQEAFMSDPKTILSFLNMSDVLMWSPTVDNIYVTGQPITSAKNLSVPLVLGTNHDEGTSFAYLAKAKAPLLGPASLAGYKKFLDNLFGDSDSGKIRALPLYKCVKNPQFPPFDCAEQLADVLNDYMFTCANRHLAIQATQGTKTQPLYLYQFNQLSNFNFWSSPPLPEKMSVPKCAKLVCHADELPYVFNTAGQLGFNFKSQEEELAQAIGGYWTRFASSHNPGSDWPLFKLNNTYLLLDSPTKTSKDPLTTDANCVFWDDIGYENSQTHTRLINFLKTSNTPR